MDFYLCVVPILRNISYRGKRNNLQDYVIVN